MLDNSIIENIQGNMNVHNKGYNCESLLGLTDKEPTMTIEIILPSAMFKFATARRSYDSIS